VTDEKEERLKEIQGGKGKYNSKCVSSRRNT